MKTRETKTKGEIRTKHARCLTLIWKLFKPLGQWLARNATVYVTVINKTGPVFNSPLFQQAAGLICCVSCSFLFSFLLPYNPPRYRR
jgi:hypothetical protein